MSFTIKKKTFEIEKKTVKLLNYDGKRGRMVILQIQPLFYRIEFFKVAFL